ncbi:MAG: hypothetical protein ABI315_00335 [Bacteroidia bacterium]
MKSTILFLSLICLICFSNSCKAPKYGVTVKDGIIQKQGPTVYQYGTHKLVSDKGETIYALTSDSINLDLYIDKKVELQGDKIKGYPISGGPDYIEVKKIK